VDIRVQEKPFDAGDELNRFSAHATGAGAVVSFTGIVRDLDGTLNEMEIEHYPGMTERAISQITEEAMTRWSLQDVMVIHRFGRMKPADQIMMVATASRHRVAAFEAAEYLMDYLKSRAPFWKKEISVGGTGWVGATEEDVQGLNRW
jgi:molybdopterin synthase catalytic subunit